MDLETLYKERICGENREEFEAYRALILEYNQRYNLTTVLEEKDMYIKHFLDSSAGVDLFKKDGKDVLAVAVVTYTSISHPAVRSVQEYCESKNIKYLRFIVGYPNKEHYVIRRVLEELGEIKKIG